MLGNVTLGTPTVYSLSKIFSGSVCVYGTPFASVLPIDVGMGTVYQLTDRYALPCKCTDPAFAYSLSFGYYQVKLSDNRTVTIPPLPGGTYGLYASPLLDHNASATILLLADYSSQTLPNVSPALSPLVASLQAQVSSLSSQVASLNSQVHACRAR